MAQGTAEGETTRRGSGEAGEGAEPMGSGRGGLIRAGGGGGGGGMFGRMCGEGDGGPCRRSTEE